MGEVKICKSGHACHQKTLGAHRPDTLEGSSPTTVHPQTRGRLTVHHQRLSKILFSNIPNDLPYMFFRFCCRLAGTCTQRLQVAGSTLAIVLADETLGKRATGVVILGRTAGKNSVDVEGE